LNKYEIYLDMDGVLVDFYGACVKHGLEEYIGKDELMDVIHEKYPEWFINLPPMKGYKDLYNVAAEMDRNEDPIVLTAAATRNVYRVTWQKQYWLAKHFQNRPPPSIVCLRSHKKDWAGPGKILIDDHEENISGWIKRGGIGILYKNHKQAIEELQLVKELDADTC
jgi:hypothetical protein